MNSLYRVLVCLLVELVSIAAFGQAPPAGKWSYLYLSPAISPKNNVHHITQDERGFIWVATEAGLAKYDGVNFRFFNPAEYELGTPCQSRITRIFPVGPEAFWLASSCGTLRFDLRMERFYRDSTLAALLPAGEWEDVVVAADGVIWISIRTKGLFRYYPERAVLDTFSFHRHLWNHDLRFESSLTMINALGAERFAISDTYLSITFLYDAARDSIHFNQLLASTLGPVYDLQSVDEDNFWAVSGWGERGVNRVDLSAGTIHNYRTGGRRVIEMNRAYTEEDWPELEPTAQPLSSDRVYSLVRTTDGHVYFGTDRGIDRFVPETHSFVRIPHRSDHPQGSSGDLVQSLFEDRDGNIWAGTQGGIRVKWKYRKPFEYREIALPPGAYGSQPARITRIVEYDADHLLLENRHHLYLLNRTDRTVRPLREVAPEFAFLKDYPIEFVHRLGDGTLWFGTGFNRDSKGNYFLFQFDPVRKRVLHTYTYWSFPRRMAKYQATAMAERVPGEVWIGARGGLGRLDAAADTIYLYLPDPKAAAGISHAHITCLYVDRRHHLWIGTQGGGLNRYDPATDGFVVYRHRAADPASLSDDHIHAIQEDAQGNLWIATAHGLNRYNPGSDGFERFFNPGQPQDQVMSSITSDRRGNFWIAQNERLTQFEPSTRTFSNYNAWDGLGTTILFRGFLERDGWIYLGGETGLLVFRPEAVRVKNPLRPEVRLTELQLANRPVRAGDGAGPLDREIGRVQHLRLRHWQNDITLRFAALEYTNPTQNQYAYRLIGLNEEWQHIGNRTTAVFTNLRPGTYEFRVKATNSDGLWSEAATALQLYITPPWYWSGWSKFAYACLLLGATYGFYRFQLQRQIAAAEAARLKELDEVKSRLYTNITHEFRTPLTIIIGMADQVITHPQEWLLEGVRMIKRNGHRLLHLVNQMLDLAKLEAGRLPLRMVRGNIVPLLRYISESFRSFAEIKGVEIHFLAQTTTCDMDFDPEKLMDIVSNLLSNAIKYTPEDGNVYVQVRETRPLGTEHLEIKISDTGVGMDQEQLGRVFDRFYQADTSTVRPAEGTGIGLALTRELVKLLEGTIAVASEKNVGTTFTVALPVRRQAPAVADPERLLAERSVAPFAERAVFDAAEEITAEESHLPLLLIVEDNGEIIQYLISCLSRQYQIIAAADGRAGIAKAIERIPDVIISDVMMPGVDGFELCRTLKEDRRTSHIPIILLTAKVDADSKLAGLEVGADAYLAKPFSERELAIRLQKLVELRQELRGHFGHAAAGSDRRYPVEDEFLREVRAVIDAHLSDTAFGVNQLGQKLHLSRSQLFRKLKALTGKSTALYIRSVRLERAKQLLRSTDRNISEIAYDVGFSSPSYFTRAFQDEIGLTPTELRSA